MVPILSRNPNAHKLQCGILLRAPQNGENADMDILLNGSPRTLAPDTSLSALLDLEGLAERRVAVEVNGDIVPRGQHDLHRLHAGDRVEIVHALGGG